MPSALETLVKILKLERENGYRNNAVIGGMAQYSQNWRGQAHEQAKRPEHHILVEELVDLLQNYEELDDRTERHDQINYMLDRITGRVPAPDVYQERLPDYQSQEKSDADQEQVRKDDSSAMEARTEPPGERDKSDDKRRESDTRSRQDTRTDRGQDRDRQPSQSQTRRDDQRRQDREASSRRSTPSRSQTSTLDLPEEVRLARPPRKPRPQLDPQEAADIMHGLDNSVGTIRGVGPRMVSALEKLGIQTINDLLFFLPRRYDDYTRLTYISKLRPQQVVTVIGTVRHTEVRVGQRGRKDFYMELDDGSGVLSIVFFGQHFLIRSIRKGQQIVVSGQSSIYHDRLQMTNPEWEKLDSDNLHTVGIVPVYPLTEGLSARRLRTVIYKAIEYWAEKLPDYVPEATLERADLADLGWTIKNLHFPEGEDHLHHARRRFIFDQLLLLQLAVLANRRDWQSVPGRTVSVRDDFLDWFTSAAFEYELTGAQQRAIADIQRDLSQPTPMNRLLQGDVGSGKTAVAATALAMAYTDGKQGAIMAPTSILAEQHFRSLSEIFERASDDLFRPVVALLTSAASQSERESIYRGLADGSIDIVIGTHSLIQEGVEFHDLGVAVIDEQHRFGVEQRGALRGKGTNPHLLVMTATPIPRTLALTMYADLDLSIMDEMPPGRTPIQTRVVRPIERERI